MTMRSNELLLLQPSLRLYYICTCVCLKQMDRFRPNLKQQWLTWVHLDFTPPTPIQVDFQHAIPWTSIFLRLLHPLWSKQEPYGVSGELGIQDDAFPLHRSSCRPGWQSN